MNDYRTFFDSNHWQHLLLNTHATWIVPAVLGTASLWLLRPWFGQWRKERRVAETLRRLGKDSLSNLSLDNGMDGLVFIDHLVLTANELLVVSLQRARGIIFGGEKIDVWARVVGRRTAKFPNPLAASEERVLAVKYHVPGVPVRGMVLFDEGCSFPKGQPEGVLLPEEVTGDPRQWQAVEIPASLQAAWNRLAELGARTEQVHGRELVTVRGERRRVRESLAVILAVGGLAWSVWSAVRLFGS